jgi:hypothetical protein
MKKQLKITFLLLAFLMLFSGFLYSQSHTIYSFDEIVEFTDPDVTTWDHSELNGSLILSWDEGTAGPNAGFCDLTIYAPAPEGGKYEISLVTVISSSDEEINGVWKITKNSSADIYSVGTATGLDGISNDTIFFEIGGFEAEVEITRKLNGLFAVDEIVGQIKMNNIEIAGAYCVLEKTDSTYESQSTSSEGKYNYGIPKENFRKLGIGFRNYFPSLVISGYIYAGGEPLANASVKITSFFGVLHDVVTTDSEGKFASSSITTATGVDNGVLVTILNPASLIAPSTDWSVPWDRVVGH